MLNYWVIPVLFALIAIILGKASEWLVSFKMFLGNVAMLWYSYNGAGGINVYFNGVAFNDNVLFNEKVSNST